MSNEQISVQRASGAIAKSEGGAFLHPCGKQTTQQSPAQATEARPHSAQRPTEEHILIFPTTRASNRSAAARSREVQPSQPLGEPTETPTTPQTYGRAYPLEDNCNLSFAATRVDVGGVLDARHLLHSHAVTLERHLRPVMFGTEVLHFAHTLAIQRSLACTRADVKIILG